MNPVTLTVGILKDALEIPVTTEVPANAPDQLVTVALEGDRSTEFLLEPRITLSCWGTTDKEAQSIASACVDAMREAALDHPYLTDVQLETMSRDLWTKAGRSRYYCELNLYINVD